MVERGGSHAANQPIIASALTVQEHGTTPETDKSADAQATAKAESVHAAEAGHSETVDHAQGDHVTLTENMQDGRTRSLKRSPSSSRDVGIFFSIYYCMTGLHAIHIIGGIIALSWIYLAILAGPLAK